MEASFSVLANYLLKNLICNNAVPLDLSSKAPFINDVKRGGGEDEGEGGGDMNQMIMTKVEMLFWK